MTIQHLFSRTLLCGLLLLGTASGRSQSLTFTTTAGYAGQGNANGSGSNARFNSPCGVAADSAGNLYVADTANHIIRKVTSLGAVSLFAGQPGVSGSADGAAGSALFNQPQGIAVDGNGVVYVADTGNHTIRKIAGGVVSTLAGTSGSSGCADGTGAAAQFSFPQGLAVGSDGSLYVADTGNHTLRKVSSAGAVTTLAGSVGLAGTSDGTNGAARFNRPQGVAIDGTGNLYVADLFNHTVRKVSVSGTNWSVTTLAGFPAVWGAIDNTNTSARFYSPQGIAVDSAGTVYVAEAGNHTIRKITSTGTVSTLAGAFGLEGSADGLGSNARFRAPRALAVVGTTLYVADTGNGTLRQVSSAGAVTTLAGSPSIGTADGAGSSARCYGPAGAAADSAGNVYVADAQNATIRKVTPAGEVTTFAGLAGAPGSVDGTGSNARFSSPQGVAVDPSGNIYVADTGNDTIRKITPGGAVTTLAGQAGVSGSLNGTGTAALFYGPQGVAVDTNGNVYVSDTWNHTIRLISPTGAVSTLAGSAGAYGTNNGTGSSARFYEPQGLAVDGAGNIYVADSGNHTIRMITPGGVVSTLAGSAGTYGSVNGTGSSALFYGPSAVMLDGSGNVYVADYFNQMLRKVTPAGVVTTVAGATGVYGSLDGAATNALFCYPSALAASGNSAFYVADAGNNALRLGTFSINGGPAIVAQPQGQVIDQATPATFNVTALGTPLSYQWRFNTAPIAGANASSYTRPNVQPGDAGSYSVIVSNPQGSVTSVDAVLVINGAPIITAPPQDQVTTAGQGAAFGVTATGALPLGYQWRFNGQNLAGATGPALSLSAVYSTNVGSYSVVVTNRFGTNVSLSAQLVLAVMPRVWGDTSYGQTNVPVGAGNAIAVAAGAWHSLALHPGGHVVAWGDNSYGQCDVPATLTDALAIAAGSYHSLAVRANGKVVAWGSDDSGQTEIPSTLLPVIGVAGGRNHTLAVQADGTVVAWGNNSYGQCNVPWWLDNVVSVAAGGHHSLALRADGSVVGWGENTDINGQYVGQSVPPQGLGNVVAISAGDYHSLAVLATGQVVAWGDDSEGQCDVPPGLTNAVAVAAGGVHSLALLADGRVVAWGANWNGQCQVPTGLVNNMGIAAGEAHSLAMLPGSDPALVLWNTTWQDGIFTGVLQTVYRRHYAIDYKNTLRVTNWTAVSTNTGNGALEQFLDPNAPPVQRFYRLRVW